MIIENDVNSAISPCAQDMINQIDDDYDITEKIDKKEVEGSINTGVKETQESEKKL